MRVGESFFTARAHTKKQTNNWAEKMSYCLLIFRCYSLVFEQLIFFTPSLFSSIETKGMHTSYESYATSCCFIKGRLLKKCCTLPNVIEFTSTAKFITCASNIGIL
jgi:hypothetical protein